MSAHDQVMGVEGVLGSSTEAARVRKVLVDTSLRTIVLTGGAWKIRGNATQIYYATRECTNSGGATLAGDLTAPTAGTLAAPAAGAPGAGALWDNVQTLTELPVPTDVGDFAVISVQPAKFVKLWMRVAVGSVNTEILGPFYS